MSEHSKNESFLKKFIPSKGDSAKTKAGKIVFLAALVILIVSIIILANYFVEQNRNKELIDDLIEEHTTVITPATTAPPETESETATTTEPPPLVTLASMEQLLADNPDTAGWIKVDGTSIDNVVVQAADNDYYLDRNFYGEKSQPGTVFADYRCVVNDYNNKQSDNIILYGHNQRDGTMFGTLNKYKIKSGNTKNFDFYLEHPTFTFSNLYEEYTYKIIASFIIEVEPRQTRDGIIFDYHNYIKFGTKRPYQTFIDNVMERSAINTGVDVEEGDKFLTLSTCSNEFEPSRFVVIGRRVRDGESPEVDTSKASINENAKEPDLNFIYNQ
ncbi:MAG: class B sortase [Oscillospiraceae bacterium]|nr:class B sortase [Oscillospiraceae bacterium]